MFLITAWYANLALLLRDHCMVARVTVESTTTAAFTSLSPLLFPPSPGLTNPLRSLAIRHALETIYGSSDPSSHPHYHNFTPPKLEVAKFELPSATNSNPYILPWAMRGLLEEEYVKERLGTEGKELVRMFEDWKPSTKGLKDVKVRLEGVRSKL